MSDEISMAFENYWDNYGELHTSMCHGDIKQFAKELYSSGVSFGEKQSPRIKKLEDALKQIKSIYSSSDLDTVEIYMFLFTKWEELLHKPYTKTDPPANNKTNPRSLSRQCDTIKR